MNYYNEIKNKLIDDEIYQKTKDYSKERHKVITYFEIGKLLYEAGGKYGDHIIDEYSKKLIVEVGKQYNRRTLFRMKQFYNVFSSEKVSPLGTQLTWSHYRELLPIKDVNKINYYINLSINQNLSKRQLQERIKSKEYERLDEKTKQKLIDNQATTVSDFIKNPILIKNSLNHKIISEKVLKSLILEDIDSFLKELGQGFCYIENEYKIKIDDTYNYIDILLYNYIYKCFVVVELKITSLKAEHVGQITKYINYIDKNVRTISDTNTIGIILSTRNNRIVLEYCSDSRIFFKEMLIV